MDVVEKENIISVIKRYRFIDEQLGLFIWEQLQKKILCNFLFAITKNNQLYNNRFCINQLLTKPALQFRNNIIEGS